ncbi:MAG: SDR family NAD(P)-dependent oxidoreductase [Planctomycetota bacterium]
MTAIAPIDWSRQVCLVTGANSGVGAAITRALARLDASVIMACRDRQRGTAARSAIVADLPAARLHLEIADLRRLADVQQLAARVRGQFAAIDVLINNAGVYRAALERTPDGFEVTFAVNHLAHFALTLGLLDALAAARGSILNITSDAHRAGKLARAPIEAIARGEGRYRGVQAYCDAKMANVSFTAGLVARHGARGITAAALHPGALNTGIWDQNDDLLSKVMRVFRFLLKPASDGAAAALGALQRPRDELQGAYLDRLRKSAPAPMALERALVDELWSVSERLVST